MYQLRPKNFIDKHMTTFDESNFKILISDENVVYRNTLAARLRLQGFNVEIIEGGFHLLHLLETTTDCSLVIMHDDMQDMPAIEIISLIRNIRDKVSLPILFISEDNNKETIFTISSLGANEFIFKSPNMQPIVERVNKYYNLLKNSL